MSAEAPNHAAIDLGASGGRVALGRVAEGRLDFEVLHRFPNRPVPVGRHLYWNVLELWREILAGLKLASARGRIASIGVTTWGVDYALLDEDLLPIDLVHSYRDRRTDGMLEEIERVMPRAEIYRHTGVQFLTINTLPQLVAAGRAAPGLFGRAAHFLMLPDLIHYWLCGRMAGEHSNASTTQLYDPRVRAWSGAILDAFGIPVRIMPELVEAGTVLGEVLPEVAREAGLDGALVVAPATHDTASAIAAVPAEGEDWAYVSSGTWALAGVETPAPVITKAACAENFTNEQGVGGITRFLKNSAGLFVLQECCRAWGEPDFAALLAAAGAAPEQPVIDINDRLLASPGADMPERVRQLCRRMTGSVPEGEAEITRLLLRSLAADTASIIGRVGALAGRRIGRVHVVGGGSRIDLLNQWLADASGAEVVAGPVEATTSGNLLLQAAALGFIEREDFRAIIRNSAPLRSFRPARG